MRSGVNVRLGVNVRSWDHIEPSADYKMEYAKSRKSLDSDCGSSDAGLVSYEVS